MDIDTDLDAVRPVEGPQNLGCLTRKSSTFDIFKWGSNQRVKNNQICIFGTFFAKAIFSKNVGTRPV